MKCPICKKELIDLKYKPFCCKRCADIDLANWFNEKYSFEATEVTEDDIEEFDNQVDVER
jgi:endogenous inhibitor of DNA gyrase (YacG/DUF329 family)